MHRQRRERQQPCFIDAFGLLRAPRSPARSSPVDRMRPALQTLADLQSRFEGSTMAVEDTWRYVAAAGAAQALHAGCRLTPYLRAGCHG